MDSYGNYHWSYGIDWRFSTEFIAELKKDFNFSKK
jgi:hypothetical protein